MGAVCVVQERQPDHCDKLIVYDGGRYHIITINLSQQPGFPIVHGLQHLRIKSFSKIKHFLLANLMSLTFSAYY